MSAMSLSKIAEKMIAHQEHGDALAAQLLAALKAECARTSQAALAGKLGVSRSYLSDIVAGKRDIGVALAKRVIGAFGDRGKS